MNKFTEKTAIGIVTCNREHLFAKCISSINPNCGRVYYINAGKPYKKQYTGELIQRNGTHTLTVANAKNKLINQMIKDGYEYLFLIEDDIMVKNNEVFQKYIETAMVSGIWGQLAFGGSGPANRDVSGKARPIMTLDYENDVAVDVYRNCVGSFAFFHKNIFIKMGMFPEEYINAMEHVDFYCKQDAYFLGLPLGFCPDIHNSDEYLEDLDEELKESVIRQDKDFRQNLTYAIKRFMLHFRVGPIDMIKRNMEFYTKEKLMERADFLEKNYARKELYAPHL
jgi:GT2 family glycosyltransferase